MAKQWTPIAHPEAIWVLSTPTVTRMGKDQVTTRLYLTLREACWGVVDGDGNGSPYSFEEGQRFGKLTLLGSHGMLDFSHLAHKTFTDLVIGCEQAGMEREYGYSDGERFSEWHVYAPSSTGEAKLYVKLRKAAHTALVDSISAELHSLGVKYE